MKTVFALLFTLAIVGCTANPNNDWVENYFKQGSNQVGADSDYVHPSVDVAAE